MNKIFISVLLLVVTVNGAHFSDATDLNGRNLQPVVGTIPGHVDVEVDEQFSVDVSALMQNATRSDDPITFEMEVTPYQPDTIALVDGLLSGSISESGTFKVSITAVGASGDRTLVPMFKIHCAVHAEVEVADEVADQGVTEFSFKVTAKSPHGRIDCSEIYLLDAEGNEISYTATGIKYTAQTPSVLNDHIKSPGLIWQDGGSYNVGDIIMTLTPSTSTGDFSGVHEIRMVFFRPKYGPSFDILDQDGTKVGVSNNNPLRSEETRDTLELLIGAGMYQSTIFD